MVKRVKVRRGSAAWAGAWLVACGGGALAQDVAQMRAHAASGLAGSGAISAPAGPAPSGAPAAAPGGGTPAASTGPAAPGALMLGLEPGSRAAWMHGTAPRWTSEGAQRNEGLPSVSIVTLPPEPSPGRAPGRSHHALSIRSETPRQALRSLGLDVTECATRFRMPTRITQSTPGGESTLEAQAQVSWACRF